MATNSPRRKLLLVPLVIALAGGAAVWVSTASAVDLGPRASADSVVESYVNGTGLPGAAVAVVHGSEIRLSAHGRSPGGRPVTPDTEMRIASLTKTFTATLAALLAREGTLDFDEPVASYLPELAMDDDRYPTITTRMLLTHRSGLTDEGIDVPSLLGAAATEVFVRRLGGSRLSNEPGSTFKYCNANYNLAMAVIEHVTGRRFADVLRDRLLAPLGMSSTSLVDPAGDHGRGFNEVLGHWFTSDEPAGYGPASGGMVSTARDMGSWMRAQLGDAPSVLPQDVLDTIQNPSAGAEYAMGWSADATGARVHSGNLFTATSAQQLRPDRDDAVVVLTNSASIVDMAYPLMQTLDDPRSVPRTLEITNRSILVLLAALVSAGAVGVARSGWWRQRTAGSTRLRRLLRSSWLLVPVPVLLGFRHLVEFVTGGRSVRWIEIVHLAPSLLLAVAVAAVTGIVVTAARVR